MVYGTKYAKVKHTDILAASNAYDVIREIDSKATSDSMPWYEYDSRQRQIDGLFEGMTDEISYGPYSNKRYISCPYDEDTVSILEIPTSNLYMQNGDAYIKLDGVSRVCNISKTKGLDIDNIGSMKLTGHQAYNHMCDIEQAEFFEDLPDNLESVAEIFEQRRAIAEKRESIKNTGKIKHYESEEDIEDNSAAIVAMLGLF